MTNINPKLKALADRLKTDLPSENVPIIGTQRKDPTPPVTVNVRGNADAWSISGVEYRNGVYTVDLAKSLLDGGNSRQQDGWVDYSKSASAKGDFYTPDYPLFYGTVRALFRAKDEPSKLQEAEEAKKFLQDTSRTRWLMTLTRIKYQPTGNDEVVHNYGMSDEYKVSKSIVNPDRFIESADSKALEAILGTGDVGEISNVFNWLNGTKTYLWIVNERPSSVDERVARFDAGSVRAGLYCDGYPSYSDASLGVRVARAKK